MSSPAPPPPSSKSESTPAPGNFENALDRLETIVQRMEADRLPLEELLSCYEEGTRLVKVCGEFLAAAEQRIELIARDAQGQPRAVEFNAANVAKTGAPAAAGPIPNGARKSSSSAAKEPKTVSPPPAAPNASPNPHEVSLF